MQLICVVECDKKSQSDARYINEIIKHFYKLHNVKIQFVYLGGKEKFSKTNIKRQIDILTNSFYKGGVTKVIYFIDYDNKNNPTNNAINKYCKENDYDLVWFNRDIEEVLLNERVSHHDDKIRLSKKYISDNKILNIKKERLMQNSSYHDIGTSNILTILNKYL